MKIIDVEQRTPEWFAARLGRVTGSRASAVVAKIKNGEAAARRDYRTELVVERLTGHRDDDGFVSKDMQRGIDLEAAAFGAYEAQTGMLVRRTGFVQLGSLMAGCSLDGDVDNLTGIVEIKCPKMATHFGYLTSDRVPANHMPQIVHNLWVTGAAWCDFVSYDDRFPDELALVIRRVMADPDAIAVYADEVQAFLAEVDRDEQAARARVRKVA